MVGARAFMSQIEITRNDRDKPFTVKTGSAHTFVMKPFAVNVIELEGLHFNHDSGVLLPIEPSETQAAQDKVSPFDVLAFTLNHAADHPGERLLITGHADTSGDAGYNVKLTELRSEDALAVLTGEKPAFVRIAKAKHKPNDVQRILAWIAATEGFACDPKSSGSDSKAIRGFQQAYNDASLGPAIAVTGSMNDPTWGAFFEMYERELCRALGEKPDDRKVLDPHRAKLVFFDAAKRSVGCGENFPASARGVENFRSAENRRSELCFLAPGNDPVLACHPAPGQCKASVCQLNDPKLFVPAVLPVDPNLLPRHRCQLHLELGYLDPVAGQPDHRFPENLPVTLRFDDGSEQQATLGAGGKLDANVDRRKGHAKLALKFGAATFIGSASAATPAGDPREVFAALGGLQALLDKGYRVFQLPPETTLRNAVWNNLPAGADQSGIDINQPSVGSSSAPLSFVLDPRWQHFKFLYHDRRLRQTLSLPALWLEAFDAAATGEPTARSSWLTDPQACQALPWILRRNPDDSLRNKPDGSVTLRVRSAPRTFVDSTAGTAAGRKLASGGAAPADPIVVRGAQSAINFDQPNAARLSFYDVPEEWRSTGQFVRLSGGTGAAPAASGDFATLAGRTTTDERPLMFQLDDMVLCNDSAGTLAVAPWGPASDRVAIFSHTFAGGPNLSAIGLYKADSANQLSFQSQQVASLTTRNLIVDYPDWTRLVISRGNVYDVFDRRVPLAAGSAVGARAAVRWVDSAAIGAPGTTIAQQAASVRPFCTIQPFYNQAHHAWWTGTATQDRRTGRFDLALLRCCGVEADGTTESALAMSYIRLAFNFNPPANPKPRNPAIGPDNPPEFNPLAVPMNLAPPAARAWVDTALVNIPRRWTGPDGSHNPTVAAIVSRAAGAGALRAKYMMFGQSLPRASAHFELGMFRNNPPVGGGPTPSVRAYMGSDTGYGTLDQGDNLATAFFTAAHETGHGISLGDEYIEQVHSPGTPPPTGPYPSPWVLSFDSNQPGGPYQQDETNTAVPGQAGMMNANDEVRARYVWHVAEWMRVNLGSPFDVSHNNKTFTLPAITQSTIGLAAPAQDRFTLVNWPLRQTYGVTRAGSPRVQHDAFLYQLGHDDYADTRLPGAVRGVASPPPAAVAAFDAIMVAIVRMALAFPGGTTNAQIHTWLQGVDAGITSTYCFRWKAAGGAGTALSRVLLHFSARYRAPSYSPNPQTAGIAPHITVNVVAAGAPGWTGATTFRTNRNAAGATALVNAFADMIGLTGANNVAGSYTTLAGEVLGGAAVTQASV